MRIFNLKRLAYFDELGKDPEVAKSIDRAFLEKELSTRFMTNLEDPNDKTKWNPDSFPPNIDLRDYNYIAFSGGGSWGYINTNGYGAEIQLETRSPDGFTLSTELAEPLPRKAIYDTVTGDMLFVDAKQELTNKFLYGLAIALDNGDREFKI